MDDKNTTEFCDKLAKASFSEMEAVGKTAHKSGLFAGLSSAEQATVVAATGAELGIPPMASLRGISIVDGKIIMSADMMAAIVWRNLPGAILEVVSTSDEECTVSAARPGRPPITIQWTIADADKAGLTAMKRTKDGREYKSTWHKFPRAMLRARAITEAMRTVFPDQLFGVYAHEEDWREDKADFEAEPTPLAPLVDAKPKPILKSKPKPTTAEPVRVEATVEPPPSRPTPEEQRDWMAEAIERCESMADLEKLGAQIKGMALPQDYVAGLRSAYAIKKSMLNIELKRKNAKELDFSDAEEFDRDL